MTTRIIGGTCRGARLIVPRDAPLRPTLGRIREDLFNILRPRLTGARFLDLFAGAGTVGLEALSRGAAHCTFVENHPRCAAALRENIQRLDLTRQSQVMPCPAAKAINSLNDHAEKFELIFIDPPYGRQMAAAAIQAVVECELLTETGMLIVQCGRREILPERAGDWRRTRVKEYRSTSLSFYTLPLDESPNDTAVE